MEFHSNLCGHRRNNVHSDHDDAWFDDVRYILMGWIANGRLEVLAEESRTIETAMSYISLAQEEGKRLKAWDAVHLCRATQWARDIGERVTVVTGDGDFEAFLSLFPTFREFVEVETVGVV